MKKRIENWNRLFAHQNIKSDQAETNQLRMIDFPDVRSLEDKLLIYGDRRGDLPPEFTLFVDEVSKIIFGITSLDTHFNPPEDYDYLSMKSVRRITINEEWQRFDRKFRTSGQSDEQIAEIMLELGLDFRDDRGRPLRCTKLLCRQAEAAARKICGKMPRVSDLKLNSWASKLEREAREFRNRSARSR